MTPFPKQQESFAFSHRAGDSEASVGILYVSHRSLPNNIRWLYYRARSDAEQWQVKFMCFNCLSSILPPFDLKKLLL